MSEWLAGRFGRTCGWARVRYLEDKIKKELALPRRHRDGLIFFSESLHETLADLGVLPMGADREDVLAGPEPTGEWP